MKLIIHTDGGSRGNPGPAAGGFVLCDIDGRRTAKAFFLGRTTNNVAEYTGLVKALETAAAMGATDLAIYSDSELMVRQLTGQYKVKSEAIRPLFEEANRLLAQFGAYAIRHVMRDKNTEADRIVNRALDCGHDVEEKSGGISQRAEVRSQRSEVDGPKPTVGSGGSGKPLRLGVLISGGGRTMLNILEQIQAGQLNAEIVAVISSLNSAGGVQRAKDAGLPVTVIRTKDHPNIGAFSRRIVETLDAAKVDLVVQGGWLCLWRIPPQYENRVMNIHPALLPCFGGKGMWGHHVHEAVLAAGCKVSGCTVHFCTNEYDKGPIIVQRTCFVEDSDTADTLAARVFSQECLAFPEAIRRFAEGRLQVEGNRVKVKAKV
jgi:phosphoribosylglycinamide formyltransferase 1